jgi:hypothetical protein
VDLLKITGPISLPKYGVTLTPDNFVETTQAVSTVSNNLPTNSPKQILADLVPVLLQKISTANKTLAPQIIQSLQDNLISKQIVIFSRDSEIEDRLKAFHYSGELLPSDRDFLSVVSSNLGGTKSDLSVEQKVQLTTTVDQSGGITNELEITRTNHLPNLPGTENTDFLRVYAPQGSRLISAQGFDNKDLSYPGGKNYKIDSDVLAWEKNSVTDNLTGTTIGAESDKTFFGNWLVLKGGETKTVKLVYQLPFKLANLDRYSLLLQKQIGAPNTGFSWKLSFVGRSSPWKNFDQGTFNTESLNSDIILDKDYLLGLVLKKS